MKNITFIFLLLFILSQLAFGANIRPPVSLKNGSKDSFAEYHSKDYVEKDSLLIMLKGVSTQFGYEAYERKIEIKGYTSISFFGVSETVSLLAGNSVENYWFFTRDFSLLWSHGNVHYFYEKTPFMKDFKIWREK